MALRRRRLLTEASAASQSSCAKCARNSRARTSHAPSVASRLKLAGSPRPPVESYKGKTPALGDHQARALLDAPDCVSLKGKRDRALLATLLHHAVP